MERKSKKADQGKVRAYVDLSALYPSDPRKPGQRARLRRAPAGRAGDEREREAMREALEGWRWI